MTQELKCRKASLNDLRTIITLLLEDDLGQTREHLDGDIDQRYVDAFQQIDTDSNQYLMVVELGEKIVGTCHLTLMPSLTFFGSVRLQIEAVRVSEKYRNQGIGQFMMTSAIDYGKSRGATIIQLTTNKQRSKAMEFYERLGFEATHEGMKMYRDN